MSPSNTDAVPTSTTRLPHLLPAALLNRNLSHVLTQTPALPLPLLQSLLVSSPPPLPPGSSTSPPTLSTEEREATIELVRALALLLSSSSEAAEKATLEEYVEQSCLLASAHCLLGPHHAYVQARVVLDRARDRVRVDSKAMPSDTISGSTSDSRVSRRHCQLHQAKLLLALANVAHFQARDDEARRFLAWREKALRAAEASEHKAAEEG